MSDDNRYWVKFCASVSRLVWRLRNLSGGYHELNQRAKVEAELFECVSGKRPMPDKNQLREWAVRLGVPEEFRTINDGRVR